jgi:hypothetical protein
MQTFFRCQTRSGSALVCIFVLLTFSSLSYGVFFCFLSRYGATSGLDQSEYYVQSAHQRFGNNIICVTEMCITTDSNPTESEVKKFLEDAISFMESESYVDRLALPGCFTKSVDDFASDLNALSTSGASGDLSDLGSR